MELRRLKYFVVLARELHFGRAARLLHVAQPALSQQIQVLENELGIRLFERNRRGVTLTDAGAALLDEADSLLRHADQVHAKMAAMRLGHGGKLRIVHNRSTPELGTASLLDEFRIENPEVDIEVESGWTAHNCMLLRTGDADAVFVRLPLSDSDGLEYLELGMSELLVVMKSGHPLASFGRVPVRELRHERVVMWPRRQSPGYYDHLVKLVWGAEGPSEVQYEPDASYVLSAVKARGGIAVLDRARAELLASSDVALRPFESPVPMAGYGLAWVGTKHVTPALARFIEFSKGWNE